MTINLFIGNLLELEQINFSQSCKHLKKVAEQSRDSHRAVMRPSPDFQVILNKDRISNYMVSIEKLSFNYR